MDTKQFHDQPHYQRLYSLLQNKAGHRKYDVIITVDNNALLFLLKYRDRLYPDVPIVFCAVDRFHDSMYTSEPSRTTIEKILAGHDGVTGVTEDFDHEQTINVALRLHPSARYVFLVTDGINKSTYYPNLSDQDVAILARKFEGRAEFIKILLSEDNLEALSSQIKPRAGQSIVLLANSFLDKDGDLVLKSSALAPMLRCDAPIYVVSSSLFQVGCAVGGYVNSSEGQSRHVMDMVAQILEGRSPDDIPIVEKSPNMYIFNYQYMTKFGITPSQLPAGSIVLNQPRSFYHLYKKRVWGVAGIIVGLLILVVMLEVNTLRRRRAEKRLHTTNIAIESSINAIALADIAGNLTYVNKSFLRLWGYDHKRRVLGKPAVSFWTHKDKAQAVLKCVLDEGSCIGELIAMRQDGSTFTVQLSATLIRDKNGEPLCMMASFIDVTERKRAEEKIIRAKEEWERTFTAVPDLIAIIDNDYRIVRVNKAMAERMGVAPDQAVGMICYECVHQTRQPPTFCPHSKLLADGQEHTEEIYEEHLGGHFIVSVSPLRDDDGSLAGCVHVARDITEHKKAEKALRESEEKYRLVIENTQDLTYSISPDGTLTFISPQVANLGYSVQEVVGQNIRQFIHPDDIQHVMANLAQTLAAGEAPSLECRLLKKDGRHIWVEETGSAVHKGDKIVQITGSIRDVTERRRAEEALRESEHRYKALFEGTAEGIVVADIQTKKFMYASPAFCAMLGYTEGELKKLGVEDIHPREHLQHTIAEFEAQARGEKTLAADIPCRRKNGEIIYADINTARVVIDGRECNVGFFTDITDRKRAEEARRETEEKYRRIVESLRQEYFFYSHGPDGVFDYVSPSIENVLGYSQKEFLTHYTEYLTDSRINAVVVHHTNLSIQGQQQPPYEVEIYHKDRSIHRLEVTEVPVIDEEGNVVAVEGIAHDITDRRKAQDALRLSEEQYRTLTHNIPGMVYTGNPDWSTNVVSNSMAISGYSVEDFNTREVNWLDIIHPDDREWVVREASKLGSHRTAVIQEYRIFDKAGKMRWVEDRKTPQFTLDREYRGVDGIVFDITERKHAEEALQKARDELEMRVQHRTADLAKAIEELRNEIAERKRAEKKLLISQNQLRSLASELSLAEERLRRKIATDVHDHVGQNLAISKIKLESLRESTSSRPLVKSLDEIRELVAQTIESTRTLTFELSPPVLYELGFEAAVEWLVRQTRQRHKLSAEFKDDGRPKPLDDNIRVLLFQAVRELLVNVAKHAQAASVKVSTRRAGDRIRISVEDDGVGIDTSEISSRSRTAGGFGLFSIRERLGHIGGSLKVSSRKGRGTRVTLVAPLNSYKNNDTEKGK
jgi:PAS domain S-box-containing protein